MEGFRLQGEKLFHIEITLTEAPYGMRAAFPEDPLEGLSGLGNNLTIASPRSRACLDKVVEDVLQAIKSNDASSLPLAKGVRYSENGQFLALGDGLWQTLAKYARAGSDEYAAVFSDSTSGSAGYWGSHQGTQRPGCARAAGQGFRRADHGDRGQHHTRGVRREPRRDHDPDASAAADRVGRELAGRARRGLQSQRNGRDQSLVGVGIRLLRWPPETLEQGVR
ncbi:hypothetical protein GGS23DRAFT_446617 [Durotheca rogersii]|uniref:uncharacterized protein n=1 Tax=Durotheca rogersii TaxID=419775 RepID=UPI00221E84F8|nr:uncharacterized protein GGS23DRAFT_446617 [Durotheca rogersii]KAI5855096.1 hypothetical protein GGS23DRAFT_446617 [Durotheca rogersii]